MMEMVAALGILVFHLMAIRQKTITISQTGILEKEINVKSS